eukprot:Tbor_TRINITY_DN5042_c0_g1::TRINITY_DN5042_c0_g1_i1::g.14400::m.14400
MTSTITVTTSSSNTKSTPLPPLGSSLREYGFSLYPMGVYNPFLHSSFKGALLASASKRKDNISSVSYTAGGKRERDSDGYDVATMKDADNLLTLAEPKELKTLLSILSSSSSCVEGDMFGGDLITARWKTHGNGGRYTYTAPHQGYRFPNCPYTTSICDVIGDVQGTCGGDIQTGPEAVLEDKGKNTGTVEAHEVCPSFYLNPQANKAVGAPTLSATV